MREYYCDCCNRILNGSEVNGIWDDGLNEGFICCKYCGAECSYYDEEADFEEEEDLDENEEFLGDED